MSEQEKQIFRSWWRDNTSADFMYAFDAFIDLSIVVFSIVISNIKKRWIIIDFDELWVKLSIKEKTCKIEIYWKNRDCWAPTAFWMSN